MTSTTKDTQLDLDCQHAIEATPGAPKWQRPNVGRSKHD